MSVQNIILIFAKYSPEYFAFKSRQNFIFKNMFYTISKHNNCESVCSVKSDFVI
jgi:hypothetical protein